jgi:AcrR family transcriptional regulator
MSALTSVALDDRLSGLPDSSAAPSAFASTSTTHDAILTSAVRVFAHLGFDRATIAIIAAAAGLSHQTVRNHFKTKERLFAEALRLGWASFARATGKNIARHHDTQGRLLSVLDVWLDLVRRDRALACLLAASVRPGPGHPIARLPPGHAAFMTSLLTVVRHGLREGHLAAGLDADAVLEWVLGSLCGLGALHRPIDQGGFSDDQARTVMAAALRGLAPR